MPAIAPRSGVSKVMGSRLRDRPAPRPGITECRDPSRASTWGSFCLRPAAPRSPPATSKETSMDVIVERCAGLDVHQASVVACVLIGQPGRKPCKEVRSFGTMTRDLEALRDWLTERGVSHVGM